MDTKPYGAFVEYAEDINTRPKNTNTKDTLYCSFCGKSQHEVKNFIAGPTVFICNECVELTVDIIVEEGGESRFSKSIEFPPEYQQAGLSILNYFSKIVEQKFKGIPVKIKIEQIGSIVSLTIQSPQGEIEKIEKTLEEYGQVVKGEMKAEDLLDDKLAVASLKNKLELADMEFRQAKAFHAITFDMQNSRIDSLENQVTKLHQIIGSGLESTANLTNSIKQLSKNTSSHDTVKKALDIISKTLAKGINKDDKEKVDIQLTTIAREEPGVFKQLLEMAKSAISSAGGNMLYSWIIEVSKIMPK
jgi:hypothetical protein